MKRLDVWSGVFWLFISIFISINSIKLGIGSIDNPGPGFIFLCGALVLGTLSILVLLLALASKERDVTGSWISEFENVNWLKVIFVLLSLTIYAMTIEWLGFLISTILLIGFLLRSIEAKRWHVVVFVAFSSAFLTYLIFEVWLKTKLPKGIFGI